MTLGWYKSVDNLDFGKEGLVGGWHKQMDIITDFEKTMTITGIKCDYTKNPVLIMFSDDGNNWNKYEMRTVKFTSDKPEQSFGCTVNARFGRMLWSTTVGSNGIHAQFLSS